MVIGGGSKIRLVVASCDWLTAKLWLVVDGPGWSHSLVMFVFIRVLSFVIVTKNNIVWKCVP